MNANHPTLLPDNSPSLLNNCVVIWHGTCGRSTGSVQEMYDLAGTNYYNPNWGYQNGEVRNSREYIIHQPVVMLRHDWKISSNTNVMTTLGYQFGNYGSTRLDWYDAPDPSRITTENYRVMP